MSYSINTNISKIAFWILSHLLFTPHLITTIRAEIDNAFTADGHLDADHLSQRCPQLHALWLETLRLTSASTALRTLTANTWLGGTHLAQGRLLVVSARQLHFDTAAFGTDAASFRATRFLDDPKLTRSASFRPFGGGPTLCRCCAASTCGSQARRLFHAHRRIDQRSASSTARTTCGLNCASGRTYRF